MRGRRGQKAKLKARRIVGTLAQTQENETVTSSTPTAACLQALPNEILQSIFLYSQNLNLARASPIFAAAFSSEHVKRAIFHLAFPSFENCLSFLEPDCFPPGCSKDHDSLSLHDCEANGSPKLQSALLRLKWVTSGRIEEEIRSAQTAFLINEMRQTGSPGMLVFRPSDKSGKVIESDETSIANLIAEVHNDEYPKTLCSYGVAGNRKRMTYFIRPDSMGCVSGCGIGRMVNRAISVFRCRDACDIPERLLHGPWTDEKLDCLRLVMGSGAMLDWKNSLNGELAEAAVREAIKEGQLKVLEALLETKIGFYQSKKKLRKRVIMPTTEHLRIAVLEGGCKRDIVECLLSKDNWKPFINWGDELIDNWAVEKEVQGDRRGTWLRTILANRERFLDENRFRELSAFARTPFEWVKKETYPWWGSVD
ncbi:MAG: hypothetical protein Q9190_005663 [Brigantiaea leucoxantha]